MFLSPNHVTILFALLGLLLVIRSDAFITSTGAKHVITSNAFKGRMANPIAKVVSSSTHNRQQLYMAAAPADGLDEVTREKISTVIAKNKVVLFMKGNKLFPQW